MSQKRNNTVLLFSLPILAGVAYTSITGLLTPGFYIKETPNWQAQSIGQDIMNLFLIVPVLLVSAFLAYRKNRIGLLLWGGTNLYLIYTYCLYAFDVHFNNLFIIYCINLGLSFYALLYFIYLQIKKPVIVQLQNSRLQKITGYYFIAVAICFYALWLMEIIPAIMNDTIPASLEEAGLFTNGVHVIDLSVFLPGLLIIGVMVLRKRTLGFILAPVGLTFMVLMDLSIAGLMVVLKNRGLEANMGVMAMMGGLALITMLLLFWHIKEINKTSETYVTG
jgi:hypothetical protein